MNTKGCIKFLENAKTAYFPPRCIEKEYWEKIDEVIKCLEKGEKYEQMWEEAKGYPESHRNLVLPDKYRGYQGGALKYIIETIEQKYFPKPVKKTITIEIEGETEDILEFTNKLNRVVGQINSGVRTNIKEEIR